jgi:hypothetical protein
MCGINPCPLLSKVRARLPTYEISTFDEMIGPSPPSVFVGRYGYPDVRVGPSAAWILEEEEFNDHITGDPADLFGRSLEEVAVRHSNLITGSKRAKITSPLNPNKILETTQEIAMASKSVDIELDFVNKVKLNGSPSFDTMSTPLGPSGEVLRAEIVGNANIPRKVDSIVEETDLLANDAVKELGSSSIGESHISRLLSTGLLGKQGNRKLVPTRWSITATDDMLSKNLWEKIRDYSSIDKTLVYKSTYLDNSFYIILTPGIWAYQMIENWTNGSLWSESNQSLKTDWEDNEPRTDYASNVTGAYYAAKLGVMESLNRSRKSAACLVWRDIGPGYWAPVGVWLIRETVRDAMKQQPKIFDSLNEAVEHLSITVSSPNELKKSWFVKRQKQTRLDSF